MGGGGFVAWGEALARLMLGCNFGLDFLELILVSLLDKKNL